MTALPDARPKTSRSNTAHPRAQLLCSILSPRWLTTVTAVVCLSLWVSNLWVWHSITTRSFTIDIHHGSISVDELDRDNPITERMIELSWIALADFPGYDLRYRLAYFQWLPSAGSLITLSGQSRRWYLEVPLWIPAVLCAPISILTWRTHIRRRAHAAWRCPACGYDLSGLRPASLCPECGR
jgi:hypothetical protein